MASTRARRWRPFGSVLAAVAVAVTSVAIVGAVGGGGATPGTANLWVDTSGGTCTRQATAGAYVDAQACGSLDAAFDAASSGDTVLVKAGTGYSGTISGYGKTSYVDISAAPGETVRVSGAFDIQAEYVSLSGIQWPASGAGTLSITSGGSRTNHVQLSDFGDGKYGFIAADDVLLRNASMGGFDACTYPDSGGTEDVLQIWTDGSTYPQNVTLDGMYLHDETQSTPDCHGFHSDCTQAYGGNNIVIRNTADVNCYGEDFIIRPSTATAAGPVTIENSYLGPSSSGEGSTFCNAGEDNCTGAFVLRNNTIETQFGNWTNSAGTTLTMTGNVCKVAAFDCQPGGGAANQTLSYNIFASGTAGTHAFTCTPTFLSDGYHLDPSDTCAVGRGNPGNFPSTDIDGDTRSNPPDAGADEIG